MNQPLKNIEPLSTNYYYSKTKCWHPTLQVCGVHLSLGRFRNYEEASFAIVKAKHRLNI